MEWKPDGEIPVVQRDRGVTERWARRLLDSEQIPRGVKAATAIRMLSEATSPSRRRAIEKLKKKAKAKK
jgi:hypothetical protein